MREPTATVIGPAADGLVPLYVVALAVERVLEIGAVPPHADTVIVIIAIRVCNRWGIGAVLVIGTPQERLR